MRRAADPLTASRVKDLLANGKAGTYAAGDRLYLTVTGIDRGAWSLRYNAGTRTSGKTPGRVYARTREMGLGAATGANRLTITEARAKAVHINRLIRDGIDPLAKREDDAAAAERAREMAKTFREVAEAFFEAKADEFAGMSEIHRHQWRQTIDAYAVPLLGTTPIADVDTKAVERVLRPIWTAKRETAGRLRGRLQKIIDFATAKGWRTGDNPARLDGPLAHLLPAGTRKVRHHPSLDWREAPAFMATLRAQGGVAARALEFLALTTCRTNEVLEARWSEVDLANQLWTVPAERMKTRKKTDHQPHKVPLSERALELLAGLEMAKPEDEPDPFIFPGGLSGKPLSDMALLALLKRMNGTGRQWLDPQTGDRITAHGMRATFRTWVSEETEFEEAVAERALAHMVGRRNLGGAYERGDQFDKRRRLMDAWAAYCTPPAASLVTLRPGSAAAA